jgi:hypothetical protein
MPQTRTSLLGLFLFMKLIPVFNRKGCFLDNVKVDDDDFMWLNKYKWSLAIKNNNNDKKTECYAVTGIKTGGKYCKIPMHRLIMNCPKDMVVDHANRDTLDNRKENLRICTHSQNSTNRAARGKSKYFGVAVKKVKSSSGKIHKYYSASIKARGVYKFLGSFPFTNEGELAAANAYKEASIKEYGDFVIKNNYYDNEIAKTRNFIINEEKKEIGKIFTSNGQTILVDEEDYYDLIKIKWHAERQRSGDYYAVNRPKKGKRLYMHRLIMKTSDRFTYVDHIDGNGINNKRSNLREVTPLQNSWNRRSKITSTSKYLGVSWCSTHKKWRASIKFKHINKTIGQYDDEKIAAIAYNTYAKKYFGEYARLNIFT